MGQSRDAMVLAMTVVAEELAEIDREHLRELLAAAQEIAEARGGYAARDVYDADDESGDPVLVDALVSTDSARLLMSSSDLC